jgi:hypothetical protein
MGYCGDAVIFNDVRYSDRVGRRTSRKHPFSQEHGPLTRIPGQWPMFRQFRGKH